MRLNVTYHKVLITLFIIIEAVGFVGILSSQFFETTVGLTPINLVFVLFVLLSFHKNWRKGEIAWMLLVFLVGFFIEVIGVKSGVIFGEYWYGKNLGIKLFDVPLAMGINWLLLCYTSVRIVDKVKVNKYVKGFLASIIMVTLDFVMEPVAVAFDFWQWQNGIIPLQNYLAWFITASALNTIWFMISEKGLNNFSKSVFLYLVAFFSVMHLKYGL